MVQHMRQFDFAWNGLQIYCTATLYPDGSLQKIDVDYILEGLREWRSIMDYTNSPIVRLVRMKMMAAIKIKAAKLIATVNAPAADTYEFTF